MKFKISYLASLVCASLVGLVSCGPDPEPEPQPSGDSSNSDVESSELWVISEMSYKEYGNSLQTRETYKYVSTVPPRIDEFSVGYSSDDPMVSDYMTSHKYSYHTLGIYYDGSLEYSLSNGLFSCLSGNGYDGYTTYSKDNYVEYHVSDYGDEYYDINEYSWNDGLLTGISVEEFPYERGFATKEVVYSSSNRINKGCYRMLNSVILETIMGDDFAPFGNLILSLGGFYGRLPKELISEVAYSVHGQSGGWLPVLFEFNNIDINGCPQTMRVYYQNGDRYDYTFKWIKL